MIAGLTPAGWVLRAVIVLGPPVALLAAAPEGFVPSTWFLLVVVVASVAFAAMPEQYAGSLALLLVVAWWAAVIGAAMPLAVVVAAAALLASHVAASVAAYGPTPLPPERRVVLRWGRRSAAVWLVAPLLWLVVDAQRGRATPVSYWVAGLAVALVLAVLVALVYPTRLDEGT